MAAAAQAMARMNGAAGEGAFAVGGAGLNGAFSGALDIEEKPLEKAVSEDLKQIIGRWEEMTADLPSSMQLMLKGASISEGPEEKLYLRLSDAMRHGYFEKDVNRSRLEKAIAERAGKTVTIVPMQPDERQSMGGEFIDPLAVFAGIPIETDETL